MCSSRFSPPNFLHVVLNNGAHDSVGGQPTAASSSVFRITDAALSLGYKNARSTDKMEEVAEIIGEFSGKEGPNLIEIKVSRGSRKNLGRPTRSPVQNKEDFMHFLAINGS